MTTKNKVSRKEALNRIDGSIVGESVIYHDDATDRYYVGPVSDLDYLQQLMADDDQDVSRDAYSHWCAGVTHGDGYETLEEAEEAAKSEERKLNHDNDSKTIDEN